MTPEQIIEVQRNEAWRALDAVERELDVLKVETVRLRRKLADAALEKTKLLREIEQLNRRAA